MAIVVTRNEVLKRRAITDKEQCAKGESTEANHSIMRSGTPNGVRYDTINKICYYLECDVGDILHFDGRLEESDNET